MFLNFYFSILVNSQYNRGLTLSSSDINKHNFVLIITGYHYLIAKYFHFDFDFNSNHWNEVYLNHNDCWLLILRLAKGLLQSSYVFRQISKRKGNNRLLNTHTYFHQF